MPSKFAKSESLVRRIFVVNIEELFLSPSSSPLTPLGLEPVKLQMKYSIRQLATLNYQSWQVLQIFLSFLSPLSSPNLIVTGN